MFPNIQGQGLHGQHAIASLLFNCCNTSPPLDLLHPKYFVTYNKHFLNFFQVRNGGNQSTPYPPARQFCGVLTTVSWKNTVFEYWTLEDCHLLPYVMEIRHFQAYRPENAWNRSSTPSPHLLTMVLLSLVTWRFHMLRLYRMGGDISE
jgi:hypothetical protein